MSERISQRLARLEQSIKAPLLEPLNSPLLKSKHVGFSVLRLDQLHERIQGNKWFKLKQNLHQALAQGQNQIVSFGGAYSNHLYALATAGELLGFKTVGVVRGELVEPLNPILRYVKSKGMTLIPVTRSEYRRKDDPKFIEALLAKTGPAFLIPEGGSNDLGFSGCKDIAKMVYKANPPENAIIAMPCGTGTTLAGIVADLSSSGASHSALGISVLKAPGMITASVKGWLSQSPMNSSVQWEVNDDFHFGGYAKSSLELKEFTRTFSKIHGIPIEPVYTGKMFFALFELISKGYFPIGSEVIALHTGGIHQEQGEDNI